MASLNKVTLIGNVGTDPEIRSMNNGKEVASFSLATSESWKDKSTGEKKEKTEWHRITVFSEGLVGVIKSYIKKGTKLYIEGALQTRKYTDKEGVEKYTTEIVLQSFGGKIIMLGSKQDNGRSDHNEAKTNGYQSQNTVAESKEGVQELDDEIPF